MLFHCKFGSHLSCAMKRRDGSSCVGSRWSPPELFAPDHMHVEMVHALAALLSVVDHVSAALRTVLPANIGGDQHQVPKQLLPSRRPRCVRHSPCVG